MTHDLQSDDDFVVNAKNHVKSDGVAFNVLKYSVGGDDTNQGEKTMADLGDRKKAMEDQYFQDAERSIKLKSRMDKLLAQWIAGLIGRDDVAAYGAEITDTRFKGGGDAGVLSKAISDLQAAGQNVSEQDVAAKMSEFLVEAAGQP
ncbi:ATPase inhibitor subunit zeta [Rhizobium leguminosarum]|uniref:ATPase inhibitor subunit zeta n=1 Tax=Rhizobium leguminosarum TaxID=384 RepID=UPI0028F43DC6|nr:ATPase inhibitor subunit zeta [Rhizobium leguminosarum]